MSPQRRSRRLSGLTLIEMIVVIAVLIILLLIAWMSWHQQINKAQDTQKKEDLQLLKTAFEEHFSDNQCYPPADILNNCGSNQLAPYLQSIPCDPVTQTPYCYLPDDVNPECPSTFRLLASLENQSDPDIASLGCHGSEFCGYELECAIPEEHLSGFNYGVSSSDISVLKPGVVPSSPTPSASSLPDGVAPGYEGDLACNPFGACNIVYDAEASGCPITFYDPDVCQNYCNQSPEYWCEE